MKKIFFTIFSLILSAKTAFAIGEGGTGSSGSSLPNPLGEGTTIFKLLDRLIYYMYVLAIPVVTILILYGAFQILTAAGDSKKVTEGKETIKWAIIGFVIVLIASGVPYIIKEILGVKS